MSWWNLITVSMCAYTQKDYFAFWTYCSAQIFQWPFKDTLDYLQPKLNSALFFFFPHKKTSLNISAQHTGGTSLCVQCVWKREKWVLSVSSDDRHD